MGDAIDTAIPHRHPRPSRCLPNPSTDRGIKRFAKLDVAHSLIRRKGVFPSPGVVDQVIRNGEVAIDKRSVDAPDREDRKHLPHAAPLEEMNVGAIVHPMREKLPPGAVAVDEDRIGSRVLGGVRNATKGRNKLLVGHSLANAAHKPHRAANDRRAVGHGLSRCAEPTAGLHGSVPAGPMATGGCWPSMSGSKQVATTSSVAAGHALEGIRPSLRNGPAGRATEQIP